MTQASLLPDTASPARADEIAPGLLRVLRQAAALRFLLAALGLATYLASRMAGYLPGANLAWMPWLLAAQGGLFLLFVLWGGARRRLGVAFLPIALGWFLIMPIVEQTLIYRNAPTPLLSQFSGAGIVGVGFEGLFLVIPVILATWQYGRRGLISTLVVLAGGQLLLAPLVGANLADMAFYLLGSLGRVAMTALLGYVVLQLVTALRAEHQQLTEANRQLARRAATADQLAESRERNRLARELHDTLAHSLTGLSVQLKALETLLAHDPAAAGAQLRDAQTTVKVGLQEARRAIQALRASPVDDLGLSEALRQLCARHAERTGLACDCQVADAGALDPLTEQSLYRVAEAALANVEQHSGATHASLSFAPMGDDRVRLVVSDDGVGFDPALAPDDRYGLKGIRERAQLLGATLRIDARPGKGTVILLEASR